VAQKDRRQRREAQSKADRARRSALGTRGGGSRRERRRRKVVVVGAAGLVVVLAAAVAAPLLFTSSNTAPSLSARTLLRLPSASAVASTGGGDFVTDDLLLRFDPATGRTGRSAHLAGRPTALAVAGGHLWEDNEVVEVDPTTLHIVRSIGVPAGPSGLAVLGGTVWVSSLTAASLTHSMRGRGPPAVPSS
jgi:hypothetical protein